MLNHIKNLTKHSAIYTVSTVIQRAQGLVMLPVYTDTAYLATKSDYGDYTLIYVFIAFLNVVYLYGLDAAFLRYFFLGKHDRKDVYRTAVQVLFITALISSGIVFLLSEPLAQIIFDATGYSFFVKIAAGILLLDTLCNLPFLILRAEEKSVTYTMVRMGRFILELALNITFVVFFKMGVKGILYANIIAAAINLVVLLPFQFPYLKGRFSKDAAKELLYFGLPMIPNGLAYLLVEVSDRTLMLYLIDKETVGEYGANYRFGTLMLLLVQAFRNAWQPFFLKIASQQDAKKIYAKVMTYFVMGAGFVVLTGSLFVEYIVTQIPIAPGRTLLGEAYWGGIAIIPIILFSYMLYGIYVNLTVGIYIEKKSHLMFIFSGLAAVANIGSNFYLMPNYGMMGAAYATLLAYIVMMLSIYIANQRIFSVPYDFKKILIIFTYIIIGLLGFYQIDFSFVNRILISLGYIVLIFLLLSESEKNYLKSLINSQKN